MIELKNAVLPGIVVANNDPIQGGRVQVFVPSIHSTLLPLEEGEYDQKFNYNSFGTNINEKNPDAIDPTKYIDILKQKLPWARVMQPITGQTGNAKFNKQTNKSTPSDSRDYNTAMGVADSDENDDGPSTIWRDTEFIWSKGEQLGATHSKPAPSFHNDKRHNSSKGNFSIPDVNANVWVQFIDGNPQVPMILGAAPSVYDFQQQVQPQGYPGSFENNNSDIAPSENDQETYRNMSVQNSGAMRSVTINTPQEYLQANTFHTGSSETHNNGGFSRFTAGDKNEMITRDKSTETRGNENRYIEGNMNYIVRGNTRFIFGNNNSEASQRELDTLKSIDDVKSKFETKRPPKKDVFNSLGQSQEGEYEPCPVCIPPKAKYFPIPPTPECKACKGTGISPSTQHGFFVKDDSKEQVKDMYLGAAKDLTEAQKEIGEGGDVIFQAKNLVFSSGGAFNDMNAVRVDKEGKFKPNSMEVALEGWYESRVPTPLIEPKHVDATTGGSITFLGNNNMNFIGGAGGLKLQSTGVLEMHGAMTNFTGEQLNLSSSNEINIGGDGESGRVSLNAKSLSFKSKDQILADGRFGIQGEIIVKGQAKIEGETGIGVTYPTEMLHVSENILAEGDITCWGDSLVLGNEHVAGVFTAGVKLFDIQHPTKPGFRLRHASTESPYCDVYVRGKLNGTNKIELPEYWKNLVYEESINVQITPMGSFQKIFVKDINISEIIVEEENNKQINCFYVIFGQRKDVSIVPEYEGPRNSDF